MERDPTSTDPLDDILFMHDDSKDPLEDMKNFVAKLDDQTDLHLEQFKVMYDEESDEDSDWDENTDFVKMTTDFLSYALGKENETKSTPKKATSSRPNSLINTPRSILTPRNHFLIDFEENECLTPDKQINMEQKDFGTIECSLSELLDEILADDESTEETKKTDSEMNCEIEEDYSEASIDNIDNYKSRVEMKEPNNEMNCADGEEDSSAASLGNTDSTNRQYCIISPTHGESDLCDASNRTDQVQESPTDTMTKNDQNLDSSQDTKKWEPGSDEDASSIVNCNTLDRTSDQQIEEDVKHIDVSILTGSRQNPEQNTNNNVLFEPTQGGSESTLKNSMQVVLSVDNSLGDNDKNSSEVPKFSEKPDRSGKEADDLHDELDTVSKVKTATSQEQKGDAQPDTNELIPQESQDKDDPYEWAYTVWRAKGLMGRTDQKPGKKQQVTQKITAAAPPPQSEPKVYVIGPVREPQPLPDATNGRERAGKWNQNASGNFGSLMQRWKQKSDCTPVPDLFSPTQSTPAVPIPRSTKKDLDGIGEVGTVRKKAGAVTNTKENLMVVESITDRSLQEKVDAFSIATDSISFDEYVLPIEFTTSSKRNAIKSDEMVGMTILSMSGEGFRNSLQIDVYHDESIADSDEDSVTGGNDLTEMAAQCQIANSDHAQGCACSASVFSGNDVLEDFFLPQLGMACTCSTNRSASSMNANHPTSLENILRPWQVAFCKSFGIRKGEQLVKAHHSSANILASAMRKWRKVHGMTRARTVSCGVALNIWARSCKYFVRSVRMQRSQGIRMIQPPSTLDCMSEMRSQGEWRMSIPVSSNNRIRTSSERASLCGDADSEVEI